MGLSSLGFHQEARLGRRALLLLSKLLPEGGVAPGEERVLAGVPAKEMRRLGVQAMVFAGGPDFVEQEGAGDFEGAVQVVGEAAVFAAGGGDERSKFGFEQRLLTFLGAEDDGQGYGVFGQLGGCTSSRLAPRWGSFCFALCHGRGDCTPSLTFGKKPKLRFFGHPRRMPSE
jgi:hypothetical protein